MNTITASLLFGCVAVPSALNFGSTSGIASSPWCKSVNVFDGRLGLCNHTRKKYARRLRIMILPYRTSVIYGHDLCVNVTGTDQSLFSFFRVIKSSL
jgi:hypothetical protein